MAKGQKGKGTLLFLLRLLFTGFLVGTIVFIFSNSADIGAVSGNKSAAVMEWVNRQIGKTGMSFQFTEHQIRKLAHFSEYMMLGLWLMLTLRVYTKRLLSHISWPLFLGLLIPVLDEGFQLLVPGRSGQVLDIYIDFAGVLAGTCIGLFILLLFRAFWQELTDTWE